MKKITAAILLICIMISFSSCNKKQDVNAFLQYSNHQAKQFSPNDLMSILKTSDDQIIKTLNLSKTDYSKGSPDNCLTLNTKQNIYHTDFQLRLYLKKFEPINNEKQKSPDINNKTLWDGKTKLHKATYEKMFDLNSFNECYNLIDNLYDEFRDAYGLPISIKGQNGIIKNTDESIKSKSSYNPFRGKASMQKNIREKIEVERYAYFTLDNFNVAYLSFNYYPDTGFRIKIEYFFDFDGYFNN